MNPFSKNNFQLSNASPDRVEHAYNAVISHFRRQGTYQRINQKFPPKALYTAVRRVLERSLSEPSDIAATFEELRDFETVDDFLEHLEGRREISKSDADVYDYALQEVEEKAEILQLQLIDPKKEVAVSRAKFIWFKTCERNWKKTRRDLNGWPF